MAEPPAPESIGPGMISPGTINVEIAYADRERQILRKVEIAANATVGEAIDASGVAADLPDDFVPAALGVFGRPVTRAARLRDGDRIELYRPLQADPKESRRRRARS